MPIPKPPYPAAFRQQMVKLVRAGRGVSDLAREFVKAGASGVKRPMARWPFIMRLNTNRISSSWISKCR